MPTSWYIRLKSLFWLISPICMYLNTPVIPHCRVFERHISCRPRGSRMVRVRCDAIWLGKKQLFHLYFSNMMTKAWCDQKNHKIQKNRLGLSVCLADNGLSDLIIITCVRILINCRVSYWTEMARNHFISRCRVIQYFRTHPQRYWVSH